MDALMLKKQLQDQKILEKQLKDENSQLKA